jgi:hypothetical protein
MPSQYLDQDSGIDPQDSTRLLEMKIHYLMSCMARAGILLDQDGNPAKVSDIVEADADEVKTQLRGDNYWK